MNPTFLFRLIGPGSGLMLALPAQPGSLNPPPTPAIGSANVATADLLVSRPAFQPCTATLFSSYEFADFNEQAFSYAPPAARPIASI